MAGRAGRRAKQSRPPRPPQRREPPQRVRPLWREFVVLCALLVGLAAARMGLAGPRLVYSGGLLYYPDPADSSVVVTPPFELAGRPSSVEVAVYTDLDDARAYFDYALIEQRTGRAIEFGREVGYYEGTYTVRERGGVRQKAPYVEGSRTDAVRVPTVPAGRYVLRIAPEGPVPVVYDVKVWRDVPGLEFYAVALLLLLLPPVFTSLGRRSPIETVTAASDPGDGRALTRLA